MKYGRIFTWASATILTVFWSVAGYAHDLAIFHTNDVHGYAFEEKDEQGHLTRLGYDRLKAVVDAETSRHKLLLDAGDVLHGQAFATSRRGDLAALVLSLVGYDALAAGNHDFDYGQERLLSLADKYRLNFVAANVTKGKAREFILPRYVMRTFDDMKVGIFGLSTPETMTTTDPRNIVGLSFGDPVAAARKMVKRLKNEGADLIIAVSHMGSEPYCSPMSRTIAEKVPGIDLIVDGHSHSETVTRVNNGKRSTLVVSAGSYFQNLGRVYVDRKPGGGFSLSAETLPASAFDGVNPDAALREAMTALRTELETELSQVVLRLPFELDGSRQNVRSASTNLGKILCNAFTEATGADVALLNGGSVRDSIAAGEVTKGALLSVLPYGNYIFTIKITGKDLLDALNHGLSETGAGAFPQFWGMEVEARKVTGVASDGSGKEGLTADSVKIGGKPLKADGRYVLAINDFLYSGGDGYAMFKKYAYHEFATLEEMFRNFVTKKTTEELQAISETQVLRVVEP
ncbi:metallophosphatase [Betaproteobacteria bacterium]|nr:metallophosphatase [Betaproteobacteria bacterium]